MKIDVCPGDDLQTFRRKERVGRSNLIQTNLTEYDVELFMNLTHEKFDIWPRPMTYFETDGETLRSIVASVMRR